MAQRLMKIVLPKEFGNQALELLKNQKNINFWQEGTNNDKFVLSILVDSGDTEIIMDNFEKAFFQVKTFRLVLLSVEASLPRIVEPEEPEKKKIKTISNTLLRISREELYSDIVDSAKLSRIYVYMTVLSTIVAAIGLLRDNVAVIIGAMVIAPFLGPNVALALSTNLADANLGKNALKTLLTGVFIALFLSILMGFFLHTDASIPEIASRTQPNLSDIILAIASGCAGVLAFTTGVSGTVIGVMVAVALLPPLTVCGLLMGAGNFAKSGGAFLLFMTNVICINLSGVFMFFIQGISPRSWWEIDKAKKSTRMALFIWSAILIGLILILVFFQ